MQSADFKKITQESYQATAQEFARNVNELAPTGSIEKFINLLPAKAKILDLGCGSGRDAKLFSELGASVLGIDFSSNLIDIAKQHAPLAEFQVMDMEAMSLPAASFDGVWSACSLGHISKKLFPNVLQNIHQLLKDHGYFYLALKRGTGETLAQDSRYEGDIKKFWAYYEEDELKNILQQAQFKVLEFEAVAKHHHYLTHDAFRIFCQKI
ncbi:MAG: class I SAM-dependent methyltransferase [Legionella sp.]|nr:MAG: class I SAM-dependent methyltransferase [Legionella sp.]